MKQIDVAEAVFRPPRLRRGLHALPGLSLAALMSVVAAPALALSALDQDWLQYDLPPRDTLVEVDTNFGLYRLSTGYLNSPGILKQHEVPADPLSGRHRYRLVMLLFHFTMPDGHQNSADQGILPGGDAGDNIGTDPRRYSVAVRRMDPSPNPRSLEVAALTSGVQPNRLEPTMSPELSERTHDQFYDGWTETESTQERVGVEIGCSGIDSQHSIIGICLGHMFIQQQFMRLEFSVNFDQRYQIFDVANEICRLLKEWKTS